MKEEYDNKIAPPGQAIPFKFLLCYVFRLLRCSHVLHSTAGLIGEYTYTKVFSMRFDNFSAVDVEERFVVWDVVSVRLLKLTNSNR